MVLQCFEALIINNPILLLHFSLISSHRCRYRSCGEHDFWYHQNTMISSGQRQHLSMPPFNLLWFRRKCPTVPIEDTPDGRYCIQTVNVIQGTKPQCGDILTTVLTNLKFQRNHVVLGVFIYVSKDEAQKILLRVSAGDFLCACTHQQLDDDLCTNIKTFFEITTKTGLFLHYLNLCII
jgi:hypothetical protein